MKRYIEVEECFTCPYMTVIDTEDEKQQTLQFKKASKYAVCGYKEIKTGKHNDHYRRPIDITKIPDWCPLPILQK